MPKRIPLPDELNPKGFSAKDLEHLGIHRNRLRAKDIKKSLIGLIYQSAEEKRAVEKGADDNDSALELARALARSFPNMWVSHVSAARLFGLYLPDSLKKDEQLHVSVPMNSGRIRRQGVVGHRSRNHEFITEVRGVRVSMPHRAVLEMSRELDEESLIILGDQLVRNPYERYEKRTEPYIPLARWLALASSQKTPGKQALKRSLEFVRVGSDSPKETLLRLALVDYGLPEPELQVRAEPTDRRSPTADMGYKQFRIAVHYDGSTHYHADSYAKDQRRDSTFEKLSWRNIKCSNDDARRDFAHVHIEVTQAFYFQSRRFGIPLPPEVRVLGERYGFAS